MYFVYVTLGKVKFYSHIWVHLDSTGAYNSYTHHHAATFTYEFFALLVLMVFMVYLDPKVQGLNFHGCLIPGLECIWCAQLLASICGEILNHSDS